MRKQAELVVWIAYCKLLWFQVLEIQREAEWLQANWGGSPRPRKVGPWGEDLLGAWLPWSSPPELSSTTSIPLSPLIRSQRNAHVSKERPEVGGGPIGAASGPTSCSPWMPSPHGMCWCCPRRGHPKKEAPVYWQRGESSMTGFYSLFQPYFSGVEVLVTVSGREASLMPSKSSSTALEPHQGGSSHLIRAKQLTATAL